MADQAGRPADWEMAKENIQPLKQGRKMAKLANCLQVRFRGPGLRIRITLIRIPLLFFFRIRIRLYTLMRIRIRILLFIKVMRICDHLSTNSPRLPYIVRPRHFVAPFDLNL